MIDALIRNLHADITLLQNYIGLRQKAKFFDMERMLEGLTIHMFRALKMGELVNQNQIAVNFPAIDLSDDNISVAVQVTSNASLGKIKKTIEAFEKKNDSGVSLKDKYKTLYIFGFCKSVKSKVPSYCKVIDPNYFISELVDRADEEEIQNVQDAIRRHVDYSSLHPWNDKDSLEIILNWINRNAIKHKMCCEGNISDMTKGLREISELIGKGSVDRKARAKSISDFSDPTMTKFLRLVMDRVSDILVIVNKSKVGQGEAVCIDWDGMNEIDRLKKLIAEDSTDIAKLHGIDIVIDPRG
ncbi:regulator [Rheinheimera sp. SA_1]|nr:regulator [Rheinheimera sp. SA_1]